MVMHAKLTKVLTAHLPLPLADKVDEMALRLDRSKGWIVKQALTGWVALEEEHRKMTLEGLEDVKAGRVISHEEMQAWAANLRKANNKK